MVFNIALILAVLSVVWADIHFLLALLRAHQWWDIIPLIGMGIITYCIGWFGWKVWQAHQSMHLMPNLFTNLGTIFRVAKDHPKGNEFLTRMTLPPDQFERELRETMR